LRGLAASAGGVTLAIFGVTRRDEFIAEARKKNRKKKGCRKDARCKNPKNPCQKGVCKKRKCRKETRANGEPCGAGLVCFDGQCGMGCESSGAPCSGDETCCDAVCTDTDTDFANCGGCDDGCSLATADACAAGACVCGAEPECSGGEVCIGGQCGT
jgi:hypothetical protein